ncbi:MAG: lipoate--protein ligase [Eubacteriaceae bacterium]|nr:lipoate--protein ligase [Eubacteriaceae bacterium]
MKYIKTNWDIPYYNMALEEHLTGDEGMDDDYVFFYIHSPSIIIGRYQNAYAEVNEGFVRERGIHVARRISGGGAVYHDRGNLNYSFIVNSNGSKKIDFARFTEPVIRTLEDLGIKAHLSGRNDLCVGERKFSGNAQYINSRKVLHHGTLLFDENIEDMVSALNVSDLKIKSKAVDSVRSRVINLKELMNEDITIEDFRDRLVRTFFLGGDVDEYVLTDKDMERVDELVKTKFSLREYNYGERPSFSVEKERKFTAGIFHAGFDVKKGIIADFSLSGDFFANRDFSDIIAGLKGVRFTEEAVREYLEAGGFEGAIANFSVEEFVSLLFV